MQTMPFRMQYRLGCFGRCPEKVLWSSCQMPDTKNPAGCSLRDFLYGDNMIRLMVNENSSPKVPPFLRLPCLSPGLNLKNRKSPLSSRRCGLSWISVDYDVAERVGFEPTYRLLTDNSISSRARYGQLRYLSALWSCACTARPKALFSLFRRKKQ